MEYKTIDKPPYRINYHKVWEPVIKNLIDEYLNIVDQITKTETSPDVDKFFTQLTVDFTKARVLLVGNDPYPKEANGIPFDDPSFTKKSIINISKDIMKEYDKEDMYKDHKFSLSHIEGIMLWNYCLSCKKGITGSHKIYWEKFSIIAVNHMIKSINVIILFGVNAKSLDFMRTKRSVIPNCHPSSSEFETYKLHPFTIINVFLKLWKLPSINWLMGFYRDEGM